MTDEAGKNTRLYYKTFGDPGEKYPTSVNDANNQSSEYRYNILGSLTRASFGGITRTFNYNSKNLLYREQHPESGITAYSHDGVGNIRTKDDGQTTKMYSYDAINRLRSISAGTQTLGFEYDDADNLTRLTSPDGTVRYWYDAADRMTKTTTTTLGRAGTLDSTWTTTASKPSGICPVEP